MKILNVYILFFQFLFFHIIYSVSICKLFLFKSAVYSE
jgi:hypothetical protein